MNTRLLDLLYDRLRDLAQMDWSPYRVPGRWVGSTRGPVSFSSAPAYFIHQLEWIAAHGRLERQPWSYDTAVTYNGLVRHTTAYDHGNDGVEGWRSTGTFLKMIGLLPYLHGLGVNTISILPVTTIGEIGRKGTLGSPYAIKHPLRIEPSLDEPALGWPVDDQLRAFVAAAHLLGMKVVMEFVLRTASVDSDLVPHHPEWFYWIDEARCADTVGTFAPPTFTDEQLKEMKTKVEKREFVNLPEPAASYREIFTSPPLRVERDDDGWKGRGAGGRTLRIPGAFADWPPDDPQPAWTDVTYLRLHDHPGYRYMAYNTVRMYERSLDVPGHRMLALWNLVAGIIPHYIRTVGIDGALIDMGHALPRDLRQRVLTEARSLRPDFLFWEEQFNISPPSRDAGYDAVVGYLPFDAHDPVKLTDFIRRIARERLPVRYFATPETHNTPRTASRNGGVDYARCVWGILRLLPGGIPFLHAGMELGETVPVNTGLGFTAEEIAEWPVEKLPLFSEAYLPWDTDLTIDEHIAALNTTFASTYVSHILTADDRIFVVDVDDAMIAFVRLPTGSNSGILVVGNPGPTSIECSFRIPGEAAVSMLASNAQLRMVDGLVVGTIEAWDTMIVPTYHAVQ